MKPLYRCVWLTTRRLSKTISAESIPTFLQDVAHDLFLLFWSEHRCFFLLKDNYYYFSYFLFKFTPLFIPLDFSFLHFCFPLTYASVNGIIIFMMGYLFLLLIPLFCSKGWAHLIQRGSDVMEVEIVGKYPDNHVGGSSVYIRGDGCGLTWVTGKQLHKTTTDTWTITVSCAVGSQVSVKLLQHG